jgi:hypothetical protein
MQFKMNNYGSTSFNHHPTEVVFSARQKKAEFKKLPTILEAANPLRRDFFEPLT